MTRAPAIKIPTEEGRIDDRKDATHLRALWQQGCALRRNAAATAQVVATLDVLLGYLGLGGVLSILANKMARRAG